MMLAGSRRTPMALCYIADTCDVFRTMDVKGFWTCATVTDTPVSLDTARSYGGGGTIEQVSLAFLGTHAKKKIR